MRLALFDLDHTLLSGDSDMLWCDFLIDHGLLDGRFRERNAEMLRRYGEGTVAPAEFCNFYASTLAGHDAAFWQPWRERLLQELVRPRIPPDARALLRRHRELGDTLVLTTATNRLITELIAEDLGVDHHLATELEQVGGCYSGRTEGVLNMRAGKVERLRSWLAEQGFDDTVLKQATFYSDSINDLPLLSAVGHPVVVDPDDRLLSAARQHGWPVLSFDRHAHATA
jgi:HAD superfamily hydrolase (TIGR01490 family)